MNLRIFLFIFLGFSFIVSFSYVNRCSSSISNGALCSPQNVRDRTCPNSSFAASSVSSNKCACSSEQIDVDVNDGEALVSGRKEGSEVFVPFNFVRKYFDIYGKFEDVGETRFLWSHSYSKIFLPSTPYTFDGPFMSFANYQVETRERVKCVSAIEGVPISTQWSRQGYFYPIQIAQFGLSHYSKELQRTKKDEEEGYSEGEADDGAKKKGFSWLKNEASDHRRALVIEDAEDRGHLAKWAMPRDEAKATRILDAELDTTVFHFQTDEPFSASVDSLTAHDESGIAVSLTPETVDKKLTLQTDLHFLRNTSSLSARLQVRGRGTFYVHYVGGCDSALTHTPDSRHFLYGLGARSNSRWIRLTRDLAVDLQKGLLLSKKFRKLAAKAAGLTLDAIILHGEGYLDNLTLLTEAHLPHFYAAADWFVKNQDETNGGWKIDVTRKLANGLLTIPPGWLSAMGQGQAMSILARAYHLTRDDVYLRAALKAIKPFHFRAIEGGVVAYLFDKFPWYEEYPTKPPLFVLNGFVYSLIGLYDLSRVAPKDDGRPSVAEQLYLTGLESLVKLLPMFDTGSGTLYDLRHLHLPGVAPNLARWDYHSTHVNQLLLLATIVQDEHKKKFLSTTAERWIGYMSGKRAAHN